MTEQAEKAKFKLRKLLKQLSTIKGRHTELVSVYVPAGYSLHEITNQLRQEQSTSENIKSKTVRKNVTGALEKIMRHLQLYKQTPEHGVAIFCGNMPEKEIIELVAIEPPEPVKVKMYWCDQRFVLEPLEDMIAEREIYGIICLDRSEMDMGLLVGKKLEPAIHLESIVPGKTRAGGQCLAEDTRVWLSTGEEKPISDIMTGEVLKSYDFKKKKFIETECTDKWQVRKDRALEITADGRRLVSSEEHAFFTKEGERLAKELTLGDFLINANAELVKVESIRLKNGGHNLVDISVKNQNFIANGLIVHNSSARFERVREGLLNDWLKEVGGAANKFFEERKETIGILLGGPGPIKEFFLKEDYMHADVKKKILGTVDTSYTGEYGLNETIERGKDLIKEATVLREKKLIQKFFEELQKPHGLAVYGLQNVVDAVEKGAVDTIILSERLETIEVEYECACGTRKKFTTHFEKNKQICGTCNQLMRILGEKDIIDAIADIASNFGSKVELVSSDTPEGRQFFELGGIGAFLRYGI